MQQPAQQQQQKNPLFERGGKYAEYKGMSWTEFLDLVILGEIEEDEAERIYYLQYHRPPGPAPLPKTIVPASAPRQAGCDCEDLDNKIMEYRRIRDEKRKSERRAGAAHNYLRHHRFRFYDDGRPYWRHRRYGWVPIDGLTERQLLAYGLGRTLARAVLLAQVAN